MLALLISKLSISHLYSIFQHWSSTWEYHFHDIEWSSDETTESNTFISATMNVLMNSLNELNMNALISLSQLIIFSSRARKQLLQTFNSKDWHIAQTLRLMLEEWEGKSKKQRAQLYEQIQTMCVEAEENEAQVQKELNQEKARTQEKAWAKQIAQEETDHSKLLNDDDDLNEMHRMCERKMTRQQIIKLVWPEWSNSTSSASTVSWEFVPLPVRKPIVSSARSSSSPASPVRETREFVQLSVRKLTVSSSRSSPRFPTSSTSSFSRSSSARDLQRSYAQIASLSPVSSVPTSASVSSARSPARDARDLRRKLKQRPSVSPPRSPSRTYPPHDSPRDSPRSSPRYSPARDSRRTPTRNASVSPSRSSRTSHGSWRTSSSRGSSTRTPLHDSSARTPSRDLFTLSARGSPSCLFVEDLYVMFHRLSEEDHASQVQRQRVFPGLTYRLSVEISVSTLSISSSRSLKRFLQRSKAKLSSWIR